MRLNPSIVIAIITILVSILTQQGSLFFPLTVLIAGVISLYTFSWVVSNRLGSNVTLSVLLKLILSLIGFYAIIGQFICIVLIFLWIF